MILVTTKNISKILNHSQFTEVVEVEYESAGLIRFEIFKLMFKGVTDNFCIVLPEAKSIRVWNSRRSEFSIIDKNQSDSFLNKVSELMYQEEGAIDEWKLSLLALCYAVPPNSKIVCYENMREYVDETLLNNITFLNDLSSIDVSQF
jgi:hypothetical protein